MLLSQTVSSSIWSGLNTWKLKQNQTENYFHEFWYQSLLELLEERALLS
jgi:hypothetical protein